MSRWLQTLEIPPRLVGMLVALAVIWTGFHRGFGRRFPDTAQPVEPVGADRVDRCDGVRHGLIIVTRNIDLSVGRCSVSSA
jgi:ABC-type xylose transport system permease subunit